MKKIISACFLISCAILLVGCSQKIPLSENDSQQLKSIYVNPDIKKPTSISHKGKAQATVGTSVGVVGLLVSAAIDHHDSEAVTHLSKNIDINKIVCDEWKKKLAEKGYKEKQGADVVLVTEISDYGLSVSDIFTKTYRPILSIKAKLIKNNRVIWQDSDQFDPSLDNSLPQYNLEEIKQNPNYIYVMLDKEAERIITRMLDNMKKA